MLANPHAKIDISFDDRYVDLIGQGVDLAIRMGQMADSTLGARYLGSNPWVMVASPEYLLRRGEPTTTNDISTHTCLVYSSVQGNDRWRLSTPDGKVVSVAVTGPLRSNNLSAVLASACAGMGLAILPWYVAREALADASLRVIMANHSLPTQEVHAVFPSPKLVPQKVTGFIEFLQHAFAGDWWLRAP
jgi:DNA-binding transcriptional LysR family regulator